MAIGNSLVGQRFGSWTVLLRAENDKKSNHRWLCRCDCGTERVVLGFALKKENRQHCGCNRKPSGTFVDMTGHVHGKWRVLARVESAKQGQARWRCQCECGRERDVLGASLRNGTSVSCGLCGPAKNQMIDLTGRRFGRLHVLSLFSKRSGIVRWLCRCDCGREDDFLSANLLSGDSTSCGCYARQKLAERSMTHGHAPRGNFSPTYGSWANMMTRCTNENFPYYDNYGGRGITVCERWHSFENFLEDMGDRPGNRSLDRIDNNAGYFPGNCRWATASEQAYNRRVKKISVS